MKRIKLSKAGMLVNKEDFKSDCNELRKLINKHSKCDAFIDEVKADELLHDISIQFEVMLPKYQVCFRTICEVVRVTPMRISKLLKDYPVYTHRDRKPASYLVDRQHYARNIIDKNATVKSVAKATGYGTSTVGRWVTDYKKFGNKMTNQAIAFRREL